MVVCRWDIKGGYIITLDSISEVLIIGVCHPNIDCRYYIPHILYLSTCGYDKEGGEVMLSYLLSYSAS